MTLHDIDISINQWAASLGQPVESILRLVLAGVAGGLVGLEREIRGRQAGFRTNLLVCLGSALVMIVSSSMASQNWKVDAAPGVNINIDPARIAYSVMAGIGFLGAGTIVHSKGVVRGLTTGAGMWCVAAIGLSMGLGQYTLATIAAGLVLLALWGLDYIEDILPKRRYRTVTVRCKWQVGCVADCVKYFKARKLEVVEANFERAVDLDWAEINLRIAFTRKEQYYSLERQLETEGIYQLLSTREL